MALPTLTKTWQFNNNNSQAALGSIATDNKTLALAVKNAMLGFGTQPWTVVYSCSSTVAGTAGDGIDRWATTANIVQAAEGAAHSWIVLKQTGMGANFQLLWSLGNGNSTNNTGGWVVSISPSAGFTGGTTTASPTATDQVTLVSSTATNFSGIAADAAIRWNVQQSTDGQVLLIFFFSGGAPTGGGLIVTKLANATGGTPGASNTGWGGQIYATSAASAFATGGSTRQNGINTATTVAYESVANLSIASEVSGVFDIFPFSIVGTAVGARGKLGTVQDIWFTSSGIALGDTMPSTGTTGQFALIQTTNAVLIPWNNTAVALT